MAGLLRICQRHHTPQSADMQRSFHTTAMMQPGHVACSARPAFLPRGCRQPLTRSFGPLQLLPSSTGRSQCLTVTRAEAEAPSRPQQAPRPSTGGRSGGGGRVGGGGRGSGGGRGGGGGRSGGYQGRGGSSGGRGGAPQGRGQGQRPAFQQSGSQGQFGGRGQGSGGRGGRFDQGRGSGGRGSRGAAEGFTINDEIRSNEIRLLGEEKEQLGVMSLEEALERAEEAEVDLVLISPDASPPVCRLIEVSKLKFQQEKAKKEAAAKTRLARQDLKELKMRPNTEEHDYQVRLRSAVKFLSKGDKVKLTCQFKGREMQFQNQGREMFNRFIEDLEKSEGCGGDIVVEAKPRMQGARLSMILGVKAPEK